MTKAAEVFIFPGFDLHVIDLWGIVGEYKKWI